MTSHFYERSENKSLLEDEIGQFAKLLQNSSRVKHKKPIQHRKSEDNKFE